MSDYLVLLKLNPGKILETLGTIRNLPEKPSPGVELNYAMSIFGAWDIGLWINAEDSKQALDFVQKKVKDMPGVNEVYTVPTFPHGNTLKTGNSQAAKSGPEQKRPLEA
jgi:hypothetical protein